MKNIWVLLIFASLMSNARVVNIDSLACGQQDLLIDVSKYQGEIDFDQIALTPVKYVYVKATEGSTHTDYMFMHNVRAAQAAGIRVGAYHFFSEKSSAQSQASHFLETIQQVHLELIPVVDVEVRKKYSPSQLVDSLQVFLDCVQRACGHTPMIYSSYSFFRDYLQDFGNSPLWLARYSRDAPDLLGFDYILWQFSEQGLLNGVVSFVDVSMFVANHRPSDIELPGKSSDGGKKKYSKREKKKQKAQTK